MLVADPAVEFKTAPQTVGLVVLPVDPSNERGTVPPQPRLEDEDDDDDVEGGDDAGDDLDDADDGLGFGDDLEDDDVDEFDDIDEDDFDDDFDDDFEEELNDDYEIEIDDEISEEFGLSTGPKKSDEEEVMEEFDDFADVDSEDLN
ncbi:MAG: hypothetical protein AAGA03_13935 [Planctomycetota bacterium]